MKSFLFWIAGRLPCRIISVDEMPDWWVPKGRNEPRRAPK